MKQLKLMVLALTLLMGTMFTSCMDSEKTVLSSGLVW